MRSTGMRIGALLVAAAAATSCARQEASVIGVWVSDLPDFTLAANPDLCTEGENADDRPCDQYWSTKKVKAAWRQAGLYRDSIEFSDDGTFVAGVVVEGQFFKDVSGKYKQNEDYVLLHSMERSSGQDTFEGAGQFKAALERAASGAGASSTSLRVGFEFSDGAMTLNTGENVTYLIEDSTFPLRRLLNLTPKKSRQELSKNEGRLTKAFAEQFPAEVARAAVAQLVLNPQTPEEARASKDAATIRQYQKDMEAAASTFVQCARKASGPLPDQEKILAVIAAMVGEAEEDATRSLGVTSEQLDLLVEPLGVRLASEEKKYSSVKVDMRACGRDWKARREDARLTVAGSDAALKSASARDMFKDASSDFDDVTAAPAAATAAPMEAAPIDAALPAVSNPYGEDYADDEPQAVSSDAMTTSSGLRIEFLQRGAAGAARPTANSVVRVHYKGSRRNGDVFDSSYANGKPAQFPLTSVISGWSEGVQMMRVGDKARLTIPPHLAFGSEGAGSMIGPNETLIFEVELLAVIS